MKLTKIALALAAVLAMSAVTASAASALNFNSGASPAMLFGSQNGKHSFKVDGQAVECNSATFEKASQASGLDQIDGVEAFYNGCTAFGFVGANVTMGNCSYSFKTPNNTPAIMGKVGVKCNNNATANIATINANVFGSECEVHVGEQGNKPNTEKEPNAETSAGLSTLTYENNKPNAGKVRVTAAVTGITANKAKDNGLCPLSGTGVTNTATYNGVTDVEATGTNISVS